MRTIIAGSRRIGLIADNTWWPVPKQTAFCDRIVTASGFGITEVVCGMARGMDTIGWSWAASRDLPIIEMPADWDTHGRAAGHIRNEEMAKIAQACIVVWDGRSPGSKNMIDLARRWKLRLYIHRYDPRRDDCDIADLIAGFQFA